MTTDRERFLARLFTGPRDRADAFVVFCGEDGADRAEMGGVLFQRHGIVPRGVQPVIVVSGGPDDAERFGARRAAAILYGVGIDPSRVLVDDTSQNTHEQAEALADRAQAAQWRQVVLIASAYHLPRAFLTVLKSLTDRGIADKVRVIVAAPPNDWTGTIPGTTVDRESRLALEWEKIGRYTDHVASVADGLAYLDRWERRMAA